MEVPAQSVIDKLGEIAGNTTVQLATLAVENDLLRVEVERLRAEAMATDTPPKETR